MSFYPLFERTNVPDMPSADELMPYLRRIDENRWYTNFGPLARSFEEKFARLMEQAHALNEGTLHVVGTGSGYQALNTGLRLLGAGKGDNILVPSVTFPSCASAAASLGAQPVLSDVDPESWTLTPALARVAARQMKIAVVMPVCAYGFPVPAEEWDEFSRETGIKLLIDAAAAVESQAYPQTALVAHSLHALKPLGIGEGGLVVTRDPALAHAARETANAGMFGHMAARSGENAKMSEYHAAVGLAQLARWEEIKRRRRKMFDIFKTYFESLQDVAILHAMYEKTIVSTLMIWIKEPIAETVRVRLDARKIPVHRTYLPPLYAHPAFANLPVFGKDGAEILNAHLLGLPFHPFLTEEEIGRIMRAFRESL